MYLTSLSNSDSISDSSLNLSLEKREGMRRGEEREEKGG